MTVKNVLYALAVVVLTVSMPNVLHCEEAKVGSSQPATVGDSKEPTGGGSNPPTGETGGMPPAGPIHAVLPECGKRLQKRMG